MRRPKIYLHWTATSYQWRQPNHYHSIVTGDGVVHRLHDYNIDLPAHTYRRNTNSIGLACACMGGADPWSTPPKPLQLQSLCREVARVIKLWGWSESEITIKNILTHAEAASNRDGVVMHENYGPVPWGGTGERWDFLCLQKNGPKDGGDQLRRMIRDQFVGTIPGGTTSGETTPGGVGPLANPATVGLEGSRASSMQVRGEAMDVLVDTKGTSWAKVSDLLAAYDIPFIWDADQRRILLGSATLTPRYAQDQVPVGAGLPTVDLALQGGASPVILVGLIHQGKAYCRVLEFAEELGISTAFNPFTLLEMRGG